jgi:hypothetical protein
MATNRSDAVQALEVLLGFVILAIGMACVAIILSVFIR